MRRDERELSELAEEAHTITQDLATLRGRLLTFIELLDHKTTKLNESREEGDDHEHQG